MRAKIEMLQDLTPPIQTGHHILMILKTEVAVTTITETILINSVEPRWATMDFFKTLVLQISKEWWLSKIYMKLSQIKNRSQRLKSKMCRRKSRHQNKKPLLNHQPKKLRPRRKSPNQLLMDKNHQKKLTRKSLLNLMICRRKSKKKRKLLRPSNKRTKKIKRKKFKKRTLSSTTWALSLLSTRPNLIGTMWNPCSRATVSKPRLATLWSRQYQMDLMLKLLRLELLPKVTPFSHMKISWKCGKLILLCNRKRDSKKNTSRASGASTKTKTTTSICMIPTGSYKSSCRTKVNQVSLLNRALLLRNNLYHRKPHLSLQTSRSKTKLMIQSPCSTKTQIYLNNKLKKPKLLSPNQAISSR